LVDVIEYGDTRSTLGGDVRAGGEILAAPIDTRFGMPGFVSFARLVGDAEFLTDRARGGDDTIISVGATNIFIGDTQALTSDSVGGNNTQGGGGTFNTLYGDAVEMSERARGVDDLLQSPGSLHNPTISMSDLFGDAQTLSGSAVGGDDSLYGAVAAEGSSSRLLGDGFELLEDARGGNDQLTSRSHRSEIMVGDAFVVGPRATTGNDLFVFAPGNGRDLILEFEQGKDRIAFDGFRSLSAFPGTGIDNFETLALRIIEQSDGSLLILDVVGAPDASDDNSVLVVGVFGLNENDFIFT
jgi:hypothetical protein